MIRYRDVLKCRLKDFSEQRVSTTILKLSLIEVLKMKSGIRVSVRNSHVFDGMNFSKMKCKGEFCKSNFLQKYI